MITTHRSDITAKEAAASSLVEEDAGINRNSGRREVVWNNLYVPEKEPEWDVDSFDGREYESDPEDREFFNDEDRYQKHRQSRIEALKNKVNRRFVFLKAEMGVNTCIWNIAMGSPLCGTPLL